MRYSFKHPDLTLVGILQLHIVSVMPSSLTVPG